MAKWSEQKINKLFGELTVIEEDHHGMSKEEWEEAEREYWNGKGHIEFFVIQHTKDNFEIEYIDYSGCAGGLQETLGVEYAIKDMWCLHKDPDYVFREGVTYTINGLTVSWTRGDGWTTDDDVDYDFESITSHATLYGYLSHKIKMIWWRQVQCRIKQWRLAYANRR